MEKVEDIPPSGKEEFSKFLLELDDFLGRCGKMYLKTYQKVDQDEGEGVMVDTLPRNFIYGRTVASPQPQLYFTDLYPTYRVDKKFVLSRLSDATRDYMSVYNFPKTLAIVDKIGRL